MITYHGHIVLLKVFLKRLNVNHCHHLLFHPILMKLHIQNHMLFSDFSKQKIAIQKTKDHYCPELILLLDLLVIINYFFIFFFLKIIFQWKRIFSKYFLRITAKEKNVQANFCLTTTKTKYHYFI